MSLDAPVPYVYSYAHNRFLSDYIDLIPEKRRENIVRFLESNSNATIAEISTHFKISQVTVRRDLKLLEERGEIKKIYGGASLTNRSTAYHEPNLLQRINTHRNEKKSIASEAITRISDGDTILIQSGSTCLELVKLLPLKRRINVITIAPHILYELCQLKNAGKLDGEILFSGGLWMGGSDDLFVGPHAIDFFKHVRIKIAFFGVVGMNIKDGWMSPSVFEAELAKTIIDRSERAIGLMDHTKFDRIASHTIGSIHFFSEIITDSGISEETLHKYRTAVKITVAR